MDTKVKRFLAVATSDLLDTHSIPAGDSAAWRITSKEHPIDGFPMIRAAGVRSFSVLQFNSRTQAFSEPIITGVRYGDTVQSIEVTAGIYMVHNWSAEHRHKYLEDDSCTGLIWCDPANDGGPNANTAILRGKWEVSGVAPLIDGFRACPIIGGEDNHLLMFNRQLPNGWPTVLETPESVFSGRNGRAYGEDDYLYLGIPWLHEHAELVIRVYLRRMEKVVAEMYRYLTPPPPQPSD